MNIKYAYIIFKNESNLLKKFYTFFIFSNSCIKYLLQFFLNNLSLLLIRDEIFFSATRTHPQPTRTRAVAGGCGSINFQHSTHVYPHYPQKFLTLFFYSLITTLWLLLAYLRLQVQKSCWTVTEIDCVM